jgi:hypothetical protein
VEIKIELSGFVQTRWILYIPTFNIESITFKFGVKKMLDACLNYYETPRQNPKKRNYKPVCQGNFVLTQKKITLIELVIEGGLSVYLAAKEVSVPYSTAKSIIKKRRITQPAFKQLNMTVAVRA